MKIAPLMKSNPWYGRVVNDAAIHADALNAVPVESTVEVELVELLHAGPEGNYRPYLHLRGELTAARPQVELPYGVSELALRRGGGVSVDAFYDFNQAQLVELVTKGYFSEAFAVPDEMSGIPWTLPGKADFLVVAPSTADEPPLVFMNLHDQSELELTEDNSGYELTAYFADVTAEAEHTVSQRDVIPVPVHDGPALDIFSDYTFDERQPSAGENPVIIDQERSTVPDGVFARLVAEIQARYSPTNAVTEAEAEEQPAVSSVEDLYESLVAPGVENVLSADYVDLEAEHVAVDADSLDTEATEVVPVVTEDGYLDLTQAADTDHDLAAQRRQARLRAEVAGASVPAEIEDGQQQL